MSTVQAIICGAIFIAAPLWVIAFNSWSSDRSVRFDVSLDWKISRALDTYLKRAKSDA